MRKSPLIWPLCPGCPPDWCVSVRPVLGPAVWRTGTWRTPYRSWKPVWPCWRVRKGRYRTNSAWPSSTLWTSGGGRLTSSVKVCVKNIAHEWKPGWELLPPPSWNFLSLSSFSSCQVRVWRWRVESEGQPRLPHLATALRLKTPGPRWRDCKCLMSHLGEQKYLTDICQYDCEANGFTSHALFCLASLHLTLSFASTPPFPSYTTSDFPLPLPAGPVWRSRWGLRSWSWPPRRSETRWETKRKRSREQWERSGSNTLTDSGQEKYNH